MLEKAEENTIIFLTVSNICSFSCLKNLIAKYISGKKSCFELITTRSLKDMLPYILLTMVDKKIEQRYIKSHNSYPFSNNFSVAISLFFFLSKSL